MISGIVCSSKSMNVAAVINTIKIRVPKKVLRCPRLISLHDLTGRTPSSHRFGDQAAILSFVPVQRSATKPPNRARSAAGRIQNPRPCIFRFATQVRANRRWGCDRWPSAVVRLRQESPTDRSVAESSTMCRSGSSPTRRQSIQAHPPLTGERLSEVQSKFRSQRVRQGR